MIRRHRIAFFLGLLLTLLLSPACRTEDPEPLVTPLPSPPPAAAWVWRHEGIAPLLYVTDFQTRDGEWWVSSYDREGLRWSEDRGRTWRDGIGVRAPVYDLTATTEGLWAATADGVVPLLPGGRRGAAMLEGELTLALAADGPVLYAVTSPPALWRVAAGGAEAVPLPPAARGTGSGALAVAARDSWLLLGTSGAGGWQSRDGGATWESLPVGADSFVAGVQVRDSLEAWLRTRDTLWRTLDGGATWRDMALPGPSALLLEEEQVIAGNRRGQIFDLTGASGGWRQRGSGLNPQLTVVALARDDAGRLVAGMQDGLWRREGPTWARLDGLGTRPLNAFARLGDGTLVAGHRDGLYRSTDGGGTWSLVPLGGGAVVSLAAAPEGGGRLWAGTDGLGVWESRDGGVSWAVIESDEVRLPFVSQLLALDGRLLARAAYERLYEWEEESRRWRPLWEGLETVTEFFTFAADPLERGRLLAGAADGLFSRSAETGEWERVTVTLEDQSVLALLADPRSPGTWWIGATRGLYRWRDGRLDATRLQGMSVNSLAYDAAGARIAAGTLFHGLYLSTDGEAWSRVEEVGERSVSALVPGASGLWVATNDGLGWLGPGDAGFPVADIAPERAGRAAAPAATMTRPTRPAPADGPRLFAHLLDPSVPLIREAAAQGFRGVVLLLPWREIEANPDEWHWEQSDAWVTAAAFYGLELVIRLDQSPAWAARSGSGVADDTLLNPLPREWADFADYAGQVATRYRGRVAGYILWNEPNLALDWGGDPPSPVGYVDLLAAAAPAIRAADPAARIAAGALAPTTRDDAVAMDDLRYLSEMLDAGGARWFDVLAVHPYPFGLPPDAPPDENGGLVLARLDRVRALLAARGLEQMALWATEFGYSVRPGPLGAAVTAAERAAYLRRSLALFPARWPEVEMLALWNLAGTLPEGDEKAGYDLRADEPALAVVREATGGSGQPPPPPAEWFDPPVALAADVRVHLGDGNLPPPWWPLYGGRLPSTRWSGGFFLARVPAAGGTLRLELFQPNEWGNRLDLNGSRLHERPMPVTDFGGKWVTLSLPVAPVRLRAGWNEVLFNAAPLLPDFHDRGFVWDDLMIRNIRFVPTGDGVQQE